MTAERTNEEVAARLAQVERAVIPGFYGANPDGSIRTFSRGGSDITGSIVARAIHADLYENWTDVSGVLVTDPRIVDNPEPIETITYRGAPGAGLHGRQRAPRGRHFPGAQGRHSDQHQATPTAPRIRALSSWRAPAASRSTPSPASRARRASAPSTSRRP